MFGEKQVQTLVELGLTPLQARVYLSVVYLGTSKAREARDYSKVARQDIYRILKELHKLGLIEKIISRPTRFRAIPLREATSILLERKTKKILQLRTKAEELVHNFQKPSRPNMLENLYPTFNITPKIKEPLKFAYQYSLKAQNNIDVIGTSMRLVYFITNYQECVEQNSQKKVKIRHIIEKTKDDKTIRCIEQYVANTPLCEVRYIPHVNQMTMIIDKKEVHIVLSPTNGVTKESILYSNSTDLVEIMSNYFELIWSQATPAFKTTKAR